MAAKARPDSVSNAVGDGISSLTWAHTIRGGSHRFLLVAVTQGDNTVSGVTYAGVSMSLIGTKTHSVATSQRTSLYGLVAPARGSNNIVVTFGGSTSNVICGAIGYNFVDQSTPTDGFVGADGEGETTIGCTVMSRDGDSVVAAFRGDSSASGYSPNGTSQWLRDDGVPYNYGGGQTRDGADGSPGVVLSWSSAPYVKWVMAGCNVRATSDTLALAVVLEEESTSDNTSYTTSGSVPAIASDEVLIVDVINGAYWIGAEQITDIQLTHNASPAGSFTREYFSGYGPLAYATRTIARFFLAGPADAGTLGIDLTISTGNASGYSILASKVLGLDTADPIAQSVFTSSNGAASPNTMSVSFGSPGGLTDASNPTYGALISDAEMAVALDANWDFEVGELYGGESGVLHVAFVTPGRETLSSTTDLGDWSDWAGLISELNLAGGAPSGITADLSQTLGDASLSSGASNAIAAALSQTVSDFTLSASATSAATANLALTLDAFTLSADGTVATPGITADLSQTLGDVSVSSAATVAIAAAVAQTLSDTTVSSAAALALAAAVAQTLGDATLSSAAGNATAAELAQALDAFSLSATGTVADVSGITADLDQTLEAVALSGAATLASSAELAQALGEVGLSSAASLALAAALAQSISDFTLSSEANSGAPITADLDLTLGAITLDASASGLAPATTEQPSTGQPKRARQRRRRIARYDELLRAYPHIQADIQLVLGSVTLQSTASVADNPAKIRRRRAVIAAQL